ncbi:hypothetical protein [Actinoplanes sp. TFC3]|uniref:hypothetical protein n=1 Tax=Actinoplanes sp. TFC3 TaxID=1710355 RepID=UPI0008326050|nr:hypothetical protein [Actinoplanes sp. TFC3]
MPEFSVHLDHDTLAAENLIAAVPPAVPGAVDDAKAVPATHHGAHDRRQASRDRASREKAGRATRGGGRSYAFRRS